MASLCLITGTVLRGDGSAFANGEVTFNSVVTQTVSGNVVPAVTAVATTDANGNLNGGSGISLIQGLAVAVALSQNGNFNSQFSAIVPNTASATFANFASGVLSLNPAAVVTGTWTPVLVTNGTQPTVTYTGQAGNYVQIGGTLVVASVSVSWSAQSGGTGSTVGVSLPIAIANLTTSWPAAAQINSFSTQAGFTWYILSGALNTSSAWVIRCGSANAGAFAAYSEAPTGAGLITGTITYRSA